MFNLTFFLGTLPRVFMVDSMGFFETMEEFYVGFLEAPQRFDIIFWGILFMFINSLFILIIYLGYKKARRDATR